MQCIGIHRISNVYLSVFLLDTGTTISDIMNATLGSLVAGHRGILPGSERSGTYQRRVFDNLVGGQNGTWDFPYIASYAHTKLRPIHGPNKTGLASFFEEYFALPNNRQKRLRSLAMLREPMNLRASAHAMAICAINSLVRTHNKQRKRTGLEPVCTPDQGLNISALWDGVVDKAMSKCSHGKIMPNAQSVTKFDKTLCRKGRTAMDMCRGAAELLKSNQYNIMFRSMLQSLMGRFTSQQQMSFHEYYSVERHLNRIGLGFSTEEVESYTLIDLGGLDTAITHMPYNGHRKKLRSSISGADDMREPDFVWFGITERMAESTCLFYYTFNVKPLKETPRQRVMECSPTSWWTKEQREEVKRREPADYAVWRAANAILDVRVIMMKKDIKKRLQNRWSLESQEIDYYESLVEAGCL